MIRVLFACGLSTNFESYQILPSNPDVLFFENSCITDINKHQSDWLSRILYWRSIRAPPCCTVGRFISRLVGVAGSKSNIGRESYLLIKKWLMLIGSTNNLALNSTANQSSYNIIHYDVWGGASNIVDGSLHTCSLTNLKTWSRPVVCRWSR